MATTTTAAPQIIATSQIGVAPSGFLNDPFTLVVGGVALLSAVVASGPWKIVLPIGICFLGYELGKAWSD